MRLIEEKKKAAEKKQEFWTLLTDTSGIGLPEPFALGFDVLTD